MPGRDQLTESSAPSQSSPPSDGSELADLSATEQHRLYASGELSPVEVCEAALERIADAEPVLHALQLSYPDRALAAARASAQR